MKIRPQILLDALILPSATCSAVFLRLDGSIPGEWKVIEGSLFFCALWVLLRVILLRFLSRASQAPATGKFFALNVGITVIAIASSTVITGALDLTYLRSIQYFHLIFGLTSGMVWIKSGRYALLTMIYFMGGALFLPLLAIALILLAATLGISVFVELSSGGILIYSILGGIFGVLLRLGLESRTNRPRQSREPAASQDA